MTPLRGKNASHPEPKITAGLARPRQDKAACTHFDEW